MYNEETSGIIWDVALNETDSYTDVFAAGLFDTDAKLSQVQLCSVAFYESGDVDKVFFVTFTSYSHLIDHLSLLIL